MNTVTDGRLGVVPNKPKTPIRGVRVPDGLWEEVQRIAALRETTPSEIVREGLERYVKRHRNG